MGKPFEIGERVKIFDRYHLGSGDVFGTVAELSDTNDGVRVTFENSNEVFKLGEFLKFMWFRPRQLLSCELNQRKLTIGDVRDGLERGGKFYRRGWNSRAQHIELQAPDEDSKMTVPYAYIVTGKSLDRPNGTGRVPWLCSQTDFLADDWVEITIPVFA